MNSLTGSVVINELGLFIESASIVERWEQPIQEAMALAVCVAPSLRILEVGYGLGMATWQISRSRPRYHQILEAHPILAAHARSVVQDLSNTVVSTGFWELIVPTMRDCSFDGIVFDAYPFDCPDFDGSVEDTCKHVTPFIKEASRLLVVGGKMAFLDFSLGVHLALRPDLIRLFSKLTTVDVAISIPTDCSYAAGYSGHVVVMEK